MLVSTPAPCRLITRLLRRLVPLVVVVAGVTVLNIGGCPAPKFDEMIPGVTAKQITDIKNDTTLTTSDQKLQALKALGITDTQLLQLLLNAPVPVS